MTHKQRVLDLLSDGQPHSHHEGYALNVILHSRVADLRRDGHTIECWRDGDLSMYQLVALAETETTSSGSDHVSVSASSCGLPDSAPGASWLHEPAPSGVGFRVGNEREPGAETLHLFHMPLGAYTDGIAA